MAKKQEAAGKSKAATKSAKGSKSAAPAANGSKAETKKKPASPAASARPSLSSEQIGETAGNVWRVLAEQGGQTVAGIKKSIDAPDDVILLALGWLAREDKLAFETSGRSVTVSLR